MTVPTSNAHRFTTPQLNIGILGPDAAVLVRTTEKRSAGTYSVKIDRAVRVPVSDRLVVAPSPALATCRLPVLASKLPLATRSLSSIGITLVNHPVHGGGALVADPLLAPLTDNDTTDTSVWYPPLELGWGLTMHLVNKDPLHRQRIGGRVLRPTERISVAVVIDGVPLFGDLSVVVPPMHTIVCQPAAEVGLTPGVIERLCYRTELRHVNEGVLERDASRNIEVHLYSHGDELPPRDVWNPEVPVPANLFEAEHLRFISSPAASFSILVRSSAWLMAARIIDCRGAAFVRYSPPKECFVTWVSLVPVCPCFACTAYSRISYATLGLTIAGCLVLCANVVHSLRIGHHHWSASLFRRLCGALSRHLTCEVLRAMFSESLVGVPLVATPSGMWRNVDASRRRPAMSWWRDRVLYRNVLLLALSVVGADHHGGSAGLSASRVESSHASALPIGGLVGEGRGTAAAIADVPASAIDDAVLASPPSTTTPAS